MAVFNNFVAFLGVILLVKAQNIPGGEEVPEDILSTKLFEVGIQLFSHDKEVLSGLLADPQIGVNNVAFSALLSDAH